MIGTIITYGLGGTGPPSSMILGPMRLYIPTGVVPPTPPIGGAGSAPLRPGEIQNFYRYVRGEEYLIPQELFLKKRVYIFVNTTINGKEYKKSFDIEAPKEQIILKSIKITSELPHGSVNFIKEVTPASTGEIVPMTIDVRPQPIEATAARVTSIVIKSDDSTETDK